MPMYKGGTYDGSPVTNGVNTYAGSNVVGSLDKKGGYQTLQECAKMKMSHARGGKGYDTGNAVLGMNSEIAKNVYPKMGAKGGVTHNSMRSSGSVMEQPGAHYMSRMGEISGGGNSHKGSY